jgi:hypothetical protein
MVEYKVWISFSEAGEKYFGHVVSIDDVLAGVESYRAVPFDTYDEAMEDLLKKLRSVLGSERPNQPKLKI